jgi:hypothetical protein
LWEELERYERGQSQVGQFLGEEQLIAEIERHVQSVWSWCDDDAEVGLAKSEGLRDIGCLFVGQPQPKHHQLQDEADLRDDIAARQYHERIEDTTAQ